MVNILYFITLKGKSNQNNRVKKVRILMYSDLHLQVHFVDKFSLHFERL